MPTLSPAAIQSNIMRSMRSYIADTLVATEGLTVLDPDIVYNTWPARWVSWSPALLSSVVAGEGRQNSVTYGLFMRGFLELTFIEKVQARTNAYALTAIRDAVRPYFSVYTVITIYDYSGIVPVPVGGIFCGAPTERELDTGRLSGLSQWSMSVPVDRVDLIEKDAVTA